MSFTDTAPIGSAAWAATLLCPQNGDASNNTNWKEMLTQLGNRLQWLADAVLTDEAFPGNPTSINSPATWHWVKAGTSPDFDTYQQDDITSSWKLWIPMRRPPAGATLVSVYVYVKGSAGHGALPANMPVFAVERKALSNLGAVDYAAWKTKTDDSASTAAYETLHAMEIGGGVTSPNYTYALSLTGEYGANSQINLSYYGYRALYTP